MASEIVKRVKENMEIELEFSDEAIAFVAKEGFDPAYGARPLRRELQSRVEDRFAEEYLRGTISKGDKVTVGVNDKDLIFEKV